MERKVNLLHQGALTGGGEKVDRLKADASKFFLAKTGKAPTEDVDTKAYQEYTQHFGAYVRNGEINASMSVGSDREGGYLVPTVHSDQIIKKLFETSPIRTIANVVPIGTDAIEFPVDATQAASGGWVGEAQSRPDTDTPTFGMKRVQVHEQYAKPKVTQKFLDDAAIDVETWLADKIAEILSFTENTAFVSGNGVMRPRGFLDYGSAAATTKDSARAWGVIQYIPSGASGAFDTISGLVADDANPLIDTIYSLHPRFRANANWVMNRATVASVRKLRDANGHYFWAPGLQVGQPSSLLNYPITEAEDMPDIAADSYSIAFGDFKTAYLIVDRIGIRTLRDPYTDKPYIVFYSTARTGGDLVNSQALKVVKFSAT